MKRRVTSFTASSRLARSFPIVKSSASIERETSRESTMSTPDDSVMSWVLPSCGRASVMKKTARVSSHPNRRNPPGPERTGWPTARTPSRLENRIAEAEVRPPNNHPRNGSAASPRSHHGEANWNSPKVICGLLAQRRRQRGGGPHFPQHAPRPVQTSADRSDRETPPEAGDLPS